MIKVAYDEITGEILRIVEGDNPIIVDSGSLTVDERPHLIEDYVVDGVITPRPSLPPPDKTEIVADGEDIAIFSFPEPVPVSVEGGEPVVTDYLEIASDNPDSYEVEVNYFPYLPYFVSVVAT